MVIYIVWYAIGWDETTILITFNYQCTLVSPNMPIRSSAYANMHYGVLRYVCNMNVFRTTPCVQNKKILSNRFFCCFASRDVNESGLAIFKPVLDYESPPQPIEFPIGFYQNTCWVYSAQNPSGFYPVLTKYN